MSHAGSVLSDAHPHARGRRAPKHHAHHARRANGYGSTATIAGVEQESAPLQIGRTGRLDAVALTNGAGDHALLLREAEQPRAVLTAGVDDGIVLMPLDDRAELRVDGDALATWLAQGSLRPAANGGALAGWASAIGLVVLLAVLVLAVLGSLTFFGWLFRSMGVM